MPSETTKGSGAPDDILTYGYVKPQVQWFPNDEDPLTDPSRITRELRGYAHRVRLHAPSEKKPSRAGSATTSAWGSRACSCLEALIYDNTSAWLKGPNG
jgi:hypothetical protein